MKTLIGAALAVAAIAGTAPAAAAGGTAGGISYTEICAQLDSNPVVDNVLVVGKNVATKDGITIVEAGTKMAYAVKQACPRDIGLLAEFVRQNMPTQTGAQQ